MPIGHTRCHGKFIVREPVLGQHSKPRILRYVKVHLCMLIGFAMYTIFKTNQTNAVCLVNDDRQVSLNYRHVRLYAHHRSCIVWPYASKKCISVHLIAESIHTSCFVAMPLVSVSNQAIAQRYLIARTKVACQREWCEIVGGRYGVCR